MNFGGLEICVLLSCVELLVRKELHDTWVFWLVYAVYKFIQMLGVHNG